MCRSASGEETFFSPVQSSKVVSVRTRQFRAGILLKDDCILRWDSKSRSRSSPSLSQFPAELRPRFLVNIRQSSARFLMFLIYSIYIFRFLRNLKVRGLHYTSYHDCFFFLRVNHCTDRPNRILFLFLDLHNNTFKFAGFCERSIFFKT